MRVVIDSNVWVSSIISWGAPRIIVDSVHSREIVPIISWSIYEEVAEVLLRPSMSGYDFDLEDELTFLRSLGEQFLPAEVHIRLRDDRDIHVVAAALSGNADAIVTGDKDLLENAELRTWLSDRHIALFSPAELVAQL